MNEIELINYLGGIMGLSEKDDEDYADIFRYTSDVLSFSCGYSDGWWAAIWDVDDPIIEVNDKKTLKEALEGVYTEIEDLWRVEIRKEVVK